MRFHVVWTLCYCQVVVLTCILLVLYNTCLQIHKKDFFKYSKRNDNLTLAGSKYRYPSPCMFGRVKFFDEDDISCMRMGPLEVNISIRGKFVIG